MISLSSEVIWVCRARLYCMESVSIISPAFSVAPSPELQLTGAKPPDPPAPPMMEPVERTQARPHADRDAGQAKLRLGLKVA